ncbi:ImmA/IrrE family metallo-endopeptidase [Kribbella solani]|uniref:ImmA/IrrE family metallo-endopeptidase n=1 Tax=Kribbella solani TaxID=236067 RepID=UPI0029A9F476|nr:ImmA/IrrE family metallo-endopeptidase [Kribbella solani]MDX2969159.1 ImmA/IrrE family metallo-endopeptidase [Kribbella solani]
MNAEEDGRAAAERFRAEHNLGVQPLGDLVATIESTTGVDVAVLDAGPDEHGLTMRDPSRDAVFIGVARTRNPMRQRSSLAHELAHVLFEDWSDVGAGHWRANKPQERRADAFARHLIVPLDGLDQFLVGRGPIDMSTLSATVQRFLVSPAMAAIALHQGGYIDVARKNEWKGWSTPQLAVRFGWRDQYTVLQADSDQRRAPQRLLARAIRGYVEGVLPAQAIATLRGMSREATELELREAGIVANDPGIIWTSADDLPEVTVDLSALTGDDVSTERGGAAQDGTQ